MQATIVNAVFQGGGIKGIALAGAVKAAEQSGIVFDRVAGTSSGGIVAALLAAGYKADEMKAIIESTPFSSFMQRSRIFDTPLIGPAVRLFLFKGLYSGDVLEHWVHQILRAKGVEVFGDLPVGKLRIIASDITNGELLVLPQDIAAYGISPDKFSVARAIRMSASIPYFFDPVILRHPFQLRKEKKQEGFLMRSSYVVDGGLLSNFPLWLFDRDESEVNPHPVIGFQTVGRAEAKSHSIKGPITMFKAMFETMLSAHDERYIEQQNIARTVKIPALGVSATQFNLSTQTSEELYESGLTAGRKFFGRWDPRLGVVKVSIIGKR